MSETALGNRKSFKNGEKIFLFQLKSSLLKIFKFLSWLFGPIEKRLDLKTKVNFKIYYVTTWLTNNCNTNISQYLKELRQSDNEISSVNRI